MSTSTSTEKTLLAAASLSFCAGSLYGWSALIPALVRSFGISTEQAGMIFSLSILAFTIAVYLTPRMGRFTRSLQSGTIFGVLAALALSVAAISSNFIMFVVAFSAGFGFCSGAIYIIALNSASQSSKPRMVTAFMVASFGLGAALFGPLVRFLSAGDVGLKALFVIAICFALAATFTFVSARGFEMEKTPAIPPASAESGFANRKELVVLLWLVFCLGSAAGLMTLGLVVSIIESRDASVWSSGITLSLVAIGNTVGRLSVGFIDEKIKSSLIVTVAMLIIGSGILACGLTSSIPMTIAGLTVIATGYGMVASGVPALTQSIFGSNQFRHTFSIVFSAWGVAGLSAPWIAGKLFDLWNDYSPAFAAAFGATLLAFLFAVLLHFRSNYHLR